MKNFSSVMVFLVLLATACGGGGKDDDSGKSWRCYEDSSGTCECLGSDWLVDGDSITEVDECTGYEMCVYFHDDFYDETSCECGDADYMPSAQDEDISDLEMVESCPVDE